MKKVRSRKKVTIAIICSIVAAIGAGIGIFFGGQAIYKQGVEDGRAETETELTARISTLGQAVNEKTSFQGIIDKYATELPDVANTESIEKYIDAIENVRKEVSNENIDKLLSDYAEKWNEFKDKYSSEDNQVIEEDFNALKTTASDLTKQIKTQFDDSIRAAIEAL